MTVPKLIHQTWKDRFPHHALRTCVESFRVLNPDWMPRFYSDEDCLAWVTKHCPELKEAYFSFPSGIHRADLFRILVLYIEGGVYADIDVECIRPLDDLISRLDPAKSVFLTRDHPAHERIHFGGRPMFMNDFMIAEPGDPLIEEILRWMLRCPPLSKSSANAVMDTGPGVMSSVIEMLGGPEQIPSLQVMPTQWIHPLPDMNCQFPESQFYRTAIASREWLKPDVFVVHYWFHTWVGVQGNTLTDNADVLLSTLGEQVERKLQWHLGPNPSEVDVVIACALAEFAEMRGAVLLYIDRVSDPIMDRFLELLQATGIKPKILAIRAGNAEELAQRIQFLEQAGATIVKPAPTSGAWGTGWTSKALVVASSDSGFSNSRLAREMRNQGGLVLGPELDWASQVIECVGVHLSEVVPDEQLIPRVVHLLPGHGQPVNDLAEAAAETEFSIRQWTADETTRLLQDSYLGTHDFRFVPDDELQLASALAVLHLHGGLVFQGDFKMAAAQLKGLKTATYSGGKEGWMLACPPGSPVTEGALLHLQTVNRKNGMAGLKTFIQERIRTLHQTGVVRNLGARRMKAHELLP